MQHAPIRRERLKPASRAAGAHHGDEIRRAQLPVYERVQRLLHKMKALERQSEVVDDERECPLNLLASDRLGFRHRRSNAGSGRLRSNDRRRPAEHRHELRECDRLHLPVLSNLEVRCGQVRDRAAVGVSDHRVDANDVDTYPEFRAVRRRPEALVATPARRE